MVDAVDESGLDGVWFGDHLVLSDAQKHPYWHKFLLPADEDWFEAIVSLTYAACRTDRLELGLAVALAAVRPPLELARQIATLSHLTTGDARLLLGVGAGWMPVEYEAMGSDWHTRGRGLDQAIDLIRQTWTGEPRPGSYGRYMITAGTRTLPTPAHDVPLLVGGDADAALRRAATAGDGWIGYAPTWDEEAAVVAERIATFSKMRHDLGVGPLPCSVVQTVTGSLLHATDATERIARLLARLDELGLERVILGLPWRDLRSVRRFLDCAATARGALSGGASS
jgi:alkanesulfonate monooxygenase SsuD/methylene tetrahydromethanopterin reductase-like flavin-dependent oxidoreductase (luciferase family)